MSKDREIWQVELARVEGVAKVNLSALARRVSALEAQMTDGARPPDNGESVSQPEVPPRADEDVSKWLAQIGRGEDTRLDALIGEIVRFLVHADKAAFARIYAAVKTEAAVMDARWNERVLAIYRNSPRRKDSSTVQTTEKP